MTKAAKPTKPLGTIWILKLYDFAPAQAMEIPVLSLSKQYIVAKSPAGIAAWRPDLGRDVAVPSKGIRYPLGLMAWATREDLVRSVEAEMLLRRLSASINAGLARKDLEPAHVRQCFAWLGIEIPEVLK
ncbi:hypothetical protein [Ideonella livida]|uniref:Uncharacterized protein n=1 Tax=Ideonella livida TaxID=2707176 RepID=A0A7C9PEZ1_9BURK|nr:hypothetical protein [Ideonella livida]NDY89752.1 hypothetical protein [Ideonella livida]